MAESNGLLDLMKSPAAMGLLAAGFGGLAGANRNTPINNLGRAGLAGLAGYSAADALQQKQRDQDKAAAIQAAIPTLYGQDGTFDYRKAAELGASPSDIKAYAELPSLGSPQAWKTLEVPGADGSKKIITLDKRGQILGDGFAGYVAPQLVDTGDKKQFVTPAAGASYQVGMSPAQLDAQNRGWANVGLRGQQNAIMGEANAIAKGLQIDKQKLEVDKLEAEKAERDRALQAQQASIGAQIGVIDKALTHPGRTTVTGLSGNLDPRNYIAGTDATNFKTVVDQLGGAAFLQAFESLKGGGQITEVEGKKATDAMARLNTAQSDDEFKASLEELRGIMAQGQARLGGAPAQGGNLTDSSNPPANLQGPQAGAVVDGYRFKGGNPADPANWEAQ
jgi:hypothetical protein